MTVLMGAELAALQAGLVARSTHVFVPLPTATFQMGSWNGFECERPVHEVTVSEFEMADAPVTVGEYREYLVGLGEKRFAVALPPSSQVPGGRVIALGESADEVRSAVEKMPINQLFPGAGDVLAVGGLKTFQDALTQVIEIGDPHIPEGFDAPDQPVVNVNWHEAQLYALLHGWQLPTEAQWERAARVVAGDAALREYGTLSGHLNHIEAHYDAETTEGVRKKPTNKNGIFGLAGNVSEWVMDWYGPYSRNAVADPMGPDNGQFRVLRGRSWDDDGDHYPQDFRASHRIINQHPETHSIAFGFRVVRPLGSNNE